MLMKIIAPRSFTQPFVTWCLVGEAWAREGDKEEDRKTMREEDNRNGADRFKVGK